MAGEAWMANGATRRGFDLRMTATSRGAVQKLDDLVAKELKAINDVLGRPVFGDQWFVDHATAPQGARTAFQKAYKANVNRKAAACLHEGLLALTKEPLEARKSDGSWPRDSLGQIIEDLPLQDRTLIDAVDAIAEIAEIRASFLAAWGEEALSYGFAEQAILDEDAYPGIVNYLLAIAYIQRSIEDPSALKRYMFDQGIPAIQRIAKLGAARAYLTDVKKLKVAQIDVDASDVCQAIVDADIGLQAGVFADDVDSTVREFVYFRSESDRIDKMAKKFGRLPADVRPRAIQFLRNASRSGLSISDDALTAYLVNQISVPTSGGDSDIVLGTKASAATAADTFDVELFEDGSEQMKVDVAAVKCAGQLFYAMTLGEEAQLFNAVNYFTHRYLVRGALRIEDSSLRSDLQEYVFSNRFTDPKTGRTVDRTRPAERAMFYSMVFGSGAPQQQSDAGMMNQDFHRLWKLLMLESAKYLERAQASFNPETYVPRQGVMQAVEDIQYNLSTHCTGMATVITPLIAAEVSFVVRKILMHREVIAQVAPSGGTWFRVLEALLDAMNGERARVSVLYNKAKLGAEILQTAADYSQSSFTKDAPFAQFIGTVDRFITTQSILQEALVSRLKQTPNAAGEPSSGSAGADSKSSASEEPRTPAAAAVDDWNF